MVYTARRQGIAEEESKVVDTICKNLVHLVKIIVFLELQTFVSSFDALGFDAELPKQYNCSQKTLLGQV
jgi:hypothetical protein